MKFKRITTNPNQMGGMPCIRSLRIPAAKRQYRAMNLLRLIGGALFF